ncbi:hypothetical protein LWI28_014502 [Acer negundo]|uniref:Uncharacterized protein n=1 Tax=Acer negundo TaxID=4023 RepID=A0AAD5IQ41_ACENE|nr:hypothetical protein LWI28_014502 [Acer negundo]KAK4849876.1 hypothetical protein QYF36_001651 [Acer negundo]
MVLPGADDSENLTWDSTTEFIFGVVTVMVVVFIFLLLLKFSCSKSKPAASNTSTEPEQAKHQRDDVQEIVVIMAGEQNPSHIAKPTQICEQKRGGELEVGIRELETGQEGVAVTQWRGGSGCDAAAEEGVAMTRI